MLKLSDQFTSNFTALDWFIVGPYLLISVAVDIYVNRPEQDGKFDSS